MAGKLNTIVHLTPFNQNISGSDESLIDLVASLRRTGLNCVVAMPKDSPYAGRYYDAGARTAFMPVACMRRSYNPLYWADFSQKFIIGTTSLGALLGEYRADVLHVNMETAMTGPPAARWKRVPCVVHVRSTSISRPRTVFRMFAGFLARYCDKAVAISEAVKNVMISGGFPEDRISVIYDPINTDKFKPKSDAEKKSLHEKIFAPLGIPHDAPVFGLIGRLNPIKGQEVFLKAAANVAKDRRDVYFILAGDAADEKERTYEARLRRLAGALGLSDRVIFMGHRNDIADIMPLLAASISPSTTEAFGRPAAEAMSCGTPAIVAATDGLKEIVTDGETGCILQQFDHAGFARAMTDILADEKAAAKMAEAGRRRVLDNFSVEIHARKMLELFQSLI